MSWVQGFVIGWAEGFTVGTGGAAGITGNAEVRNRFGTDTGLLFDPPDPDAIAVWLDDYCRTHALDAMVHAARALVVELGKRSPLGQKAARPK